MTDAAVCFDNLGFFYEADHWVLRGYSGRVERGRAFAILGPNGRGKTTLLKLLTGRLEPDSGAVRLSPTLEPAYFDQKRTALDPEAGLRQILCPFGGDSVLVNGKPRHVASYLKDFLFDSRQLDSPVRTLSGGERNRLLLALLFARPSNLLIMDEPTNDLDMDTLDLLQEVLSDYQGTLLLVSHDRDFLDRLVTSTIAVEGDGTVAEYAGGYSDYLRQRPPPPAPARPTPRPAEAEATGTGIRSRRKLGYRQQRELDQLPERIEALTRAVAALAEQVADPDLFRRDPAAYPRLTAALEERQAELAAAEESWLELEALREDLERGA